MRRRLKMIDSAENIYIHTCVRMFHSYPCFYCIKCNIILIHFLCCSHCVKLSYWWEIIFNRFFWYFGKLWSVLSYDNALLKRLFEYIMSWINFHRYNLEYNFIIYFVCIIIKWYAYKIIEIRSTLVNADEINRWSSNTNGYDISFCISPTVKTKYK